MSTSAKLERPKNYFNNITFVLKVIGISLTGNESKAYKVYSFLSLFLLSLMYPILDFREIFVHEFDVVANMVTYELAVFVTLAKTTVAFRNRIKLGQILAKFEQEPFIPNLERGGDVEETLIRDCVWITNAQAAVYWTFGFICVSFATVITLIKRIRSNDYHDWEFFYGPFTILNVTYSPNFEISWFYQTLSISFISTHFVTIDLLSAAVLAHISFQFKILQNNFRRIVKNSLRMMDEEQGKLRSLPSCESHPHSDLENNNKIPWKYLKTCLVNAINYHLAITEMAKEIEEVFSSLLLFEFVGTLGMLSFLVYHSSIALASNDSSKVGIIISEGICISLQVLTVCFWGERVMHESQQVGMAISESDFVGCDIKFQKCLILIIRRSQNPTKMTAGKFADICLSTFTWVLRASYSAFMVVYNKSSEKNL